MNEPIIERGWLVQEVSHLLIDLPLFSGSRIVIMLDYQPEGQRDAAIDLDPPEDTEISTQRGKTLDEIDEFEVGEEAKTDEQVADFAELLNAPQHSTEFPSEIGSRPVDLSADWTACLSGAGGSEAQETGNE